MIKNKITVDIVNDNFESNPKGDDSGVLINALCKNEKYFAEIYWDDDADMGALACEYSLKRVGSNLVEIHSENDHINNIDYLVCDDDLNPITWGGMIYQKTVELVKMVKQYSVSNPQFWVEEGDHYFAYTMYLKGKTVGEVINKLADMYLEVEANIPETIDELKNQIIKTQ